MQLNVSVVINVVNKKHVSKKHCKIAIVTLTFTVDEFLIITFETAVLNRTSHAVVPLSQFVHRPC